MKTAAVLCIMDGFGIAPEGRGNAIAAANTPNIDRLMAEMPFTLLDASGRAVGLPEGQMGNSEVGHMNMGAGRVVWQDLSMISNDIESGAFFENEALLAAADNAAGAGPEGCAGAESRALHILGLMSDGGVHSHIEHIKAIAKLAAARGAERIFVHCFTDGRDVPPTSGAGYAEEMAGYLSELAGADARIGSVCGRYYAMDRDKRWDRVAKAYDMLTSPSGREEDAAAYLRGCYERGVTDEFAEPAAIRGFDGIKDGDSVIFANFRPDRARELTRAFTDPSFGGFSRKVLLCGLTYACMTSYDETIPGVLVAYPPKEIKNTLGEYLSSAGGTQLRIAETEKYAHVTFFFNGGREAPFEGEERILVPSPKVATYDMQPEMSAREVAERACARIRSEGGRRPDLTIINFANCDMVGHTGEFDAAVKAVETVDTCVGKLCEAVRAAGGRLLVTADHGNADCMLDEKGCAVTAHSTNPVPLIFCDYSDEAINCRLSSGGALCDIAPTLLEMMDMEKPSEMEGRSLIERP